MATASPAGLDEFISRFTSQVDSGFGLISGDVQAVLGTLVVISIAATAILWVIDETTNVLASLVRKVLLVGFFAWLISNWHALSVTVVTGFGQLGLKAAGGSSIGDFMSAPTNVTNAGVKVCLGLVAYIGKLASQNGGLGALWHIDVILIAAVACIGVLISFVILAVEIAVTIVEFHLVTLIAFVTVPFGVLTQTSFLSERAIGYVVSVGLKFMALAVIIGVGLNIFDTYTVSSDPTIAEETGLLLAAVFLLMLALKVPGVAGALISGGPQLSSGSALAGAAGLAAGVAGVALAGRAAGAAIAGGWAQGGKLAAARAASGAIGDGAPPGAPGTEGGGGDSPPRGPPAPSGVARSAGPGAGAGAGRRPGTADTQGRQARGEGPSAEPPDTGSSTGAPPTNTSTSDAASAKQLGGAEAVRAFARAPVSSAIAYSRVAAEGFRSGRDEAGAEADASSDSGSAAPPNSVTTSTSGAGVGPTRASSGSYTASPAAAGRSAAGTARAPAGVTTAAATEDRIASASSAAEDVLATSNAATEDLQASTPTPPSRGPVPTPAQTVARARQRRSRAQAIARSAAARAVAAVGSDGGAGMSATPATVTDAPSPELELIE